ncbi:hypothetical protein FRC03_007630 [Tulasnella sp. 419]|nr:hypothetical protein FRC03_007630 [Tulasnella sp. 419]
MMNLPPSPTSPINSKLHSPIIPHATSTPPQLPPKSALRKTTAPLKITVKSQPAAPSTSLLTPSPTPTITPKDLPPPDLTSRSRSRLDSVGSDGSAAITAGAFRQAQARRSTTNLVETGVTTPGRRSLSNDPANPRRPSLEGSVLLNTRSPSPFGHQAQQMPLPGAPAPPPSAPLLVSTSTAAGGGFRIGSEPPPRPPRNRPPGPAISTSDLLGSKSQPNTPAKMSSSNLFSNVDTTETESESEDSESQTESGSEGEEESESGSDSGSEEESEEEEDDDDDDEPLAHQVRLVGAKKPVDRKTTITQRSASANVTGSGFNGKRSKLNPNVNARPQPAGGPHPRAASMPLEAMVLKNPPPRTSSLNVNAVSSSPVRPASSGDLLVGSKSGMLEVPSHTPRKRSVSPIGPETKGTSPYRDDDRRSDKNSSSPHYSSSTVKPQHSSNTPGTVRSKKALAQPSQGSDSEESESDDSVESEDIPLGIKRSTSAMVLGKPTPGVAFTTSKSDLGHGGMMSSAKSDASHGGKRNFSSSSSVMTTSNGSPPRHRKTPSKASSQGLVDLASPSTFDAPRNQTKGSHAGPINTHHRTPQQPLKSAMRPGSSLNGHSSSSNNSPTSTNGNPQNKWLSAPLSSPNSSLLSTPATSIFSQPPSRPFAVPAFGYSSSPNGSSIGDSSSGKMPLTPREGSEASSGVSSGDRRFNGNPQRGHARKGSVTFEEPNGKGGNNGDSEERRKERRRSEAKQAIQMGNAINGPLPDVDVDNESIYSGSNHHHSQNQVNPMNMGMPGANMPMGMGSPWEWNQQQMLMMLANQSMNTLPGIGVPSFMPQAGAGGQQQQGNVDPAAFLSAHQQAMLYAKHTFQLAIAQQAMQAAGEEWERSSHAGGSVMNGMGGGGTPLMGMGMNMPMGMSPLGMGMMGMPGMMFPSAPASVYGGSVAGSVYGGGSGSRLGVPVPRSGQSDIGLGSPPNAGKQRPRTRTASGVGSLPLQHQRNQNQNQGIPRKPSPPSSWKKS